MKGKNYIKRALIPVALTIFVTFQLPAEQPAVTSNENYTTLQDGSDEVQYWEGTFTIRFQGQTEQKNEEDPVLGHIFSFDHSVVVHFKTAKGMLNNPDESDLGIKGDQEDIMQKLQSGQMDIEALQKMAEKIQTSGMGTSDIMFWTATDGFDNTELQTGSVSVEMTANDKMHEVVGDVGEGYCCNITQEGTWTGRSITKDFSIRLNVNKVAGKYDLAVRWKNEMPSVSYKYDFIKVEKCPGWSHSCDPPADYTETVTGYLPWNMQERTTSVKEELQDLPLENESAGIKGSKILKGLFEIDGAPVDVNISWDIQPVM